MPYVTSKPTMAVVIAFNSHYSATIDGPDAVYIFPLPAALMPALDPETLPKKERKRARAQQERIRAAFETKILRHANRRVAKELYDDEPTRSQVNDQYYFYVQYPPILNELPAKR